MPKTSIEAQRLFLRELARQAPQIVHDLFRRGDPREWAVAWGFLSDWVIDRAASALNKRSGNPEGIRRMRQRGVSPDTLRAWEAEELRAWEAATHSPFRPPDLIISVFDDDEDFRYLTPAELADRVKRRLDGAMAAYHKAVFEDHPYFGAYRELPTTRAGQDERHRRWLIEYVTGKSDPDIAANEYSATGEAVDADTVRMGRQSLAKKMELKVKDRRGTGNRRRRS